MDESCKVKRTDVSKTYSNTLPKYLKHTCCHLLCKSLSGVGFITRVQCPQSLKDMCWRVSLPLLVFILVSNNLSSAVILITPDNCPQSLKDLHNKWQQVCLVDKLFEHRKFFKMKGYNCVWHLLFILLCLVQIKRNIYNSVTLSDKMLCEDWFTPLPSVVKSGLC
jgi:hypothetical protein